MLICSAGARRLGLLLGAALLAGACASPPAGHRQPRATPSAVAATAAVPASPPTPPPATPAPALSDPGPFSYDLSTVASGLKVPWALAFAPDGGLWFTERGGQVRVFRNGSLIPAPALTLSVVSRPGCEGGLLGLDLRGGAAYLYYTRQGGTGLANRVSRFTVSGDRLVDERVLLDGIPAGDCYHDGGRLKVGPDGLLYFTTGEGYVAARATDPGNLSGKVMRMNVDGSGLEMFAWGFRNPQGLAWDPAGRLYVSNNGPTGDLGLCCHDEVDAVLQARSFFGWPAWAGTVRTGFVAGGLPDRVPPVAESGTATWAPSGLAFFAASRSERPALFMAELRGEALRRLVINPADPSRAVREEVVLQSQGRLRDAAAGPDGCLYVATSDRDGRSSPRPDDDRILKLCPR